MSEYIERKVLLEAVEKMDRLVKETETPYEYDKQGYLLLINNAPGIEIVRCKECKYWDAVKNPKYKGVGILRSHEKGPRRILRPPRRYKR